MNVILVFEMGILRTPVLVKDNETALATFRQIVTDLLGADVSELTLINEEELPKINDLLRGFAEVQWFEQVEVNEYINE